MHFREKRIKMLVCMSTIIENHACIPFSEMLEGRNIGTPKYSEVSFRSETMYISLLGFAPAGWLPRKKKKVGKVFCLHTQQVQCNYISAVTKVLLPVDLHIYLII